MSETGLEFDPPLATDATGRTVNSFARSSRAEPAELVLRPAFQRNMVWNGQQQSFLIDSILRGLPVPELYVQTRTSADGAEVLTVVDGQQRLSACLAFERNELRLDNSDDLDDRWKGHIFAELDDPLKSRFRSFKFIVRELPATADEGVLREIFRRLNRTVESLEPQELRHAAYTGPFIRLVERAGAAASLQDLGVFSPKDYLRRRNDEFVAEVLYAIFAGAFPNKKEGLDEAFLTFERQGFADEVDITRRFGRAQSFVDACSVALRRTRFRNKSDCYSLLVYLAQRAESVPSDAESAHEVVQALVEFSSLVNSIKRAESAGESIDPLVKQVGGAAALSYLRAVERAASDRLSRVRRNDALEALLDSTLAQLETRPLGQRDEEWRLAGADLEDPVEDEDPEVERAAVEASLLGAGTLPSSL